MENQEINYDWETRQESMPFQYHMIAGCTAGIVEHVSMLPFDTIKTHQQVFKNQNASQVMKMIYERGGLKSFYEGLQVVATGCMPAHAAYFSVYEISKKKFGIDDDEHHPYLFALTGAIATFFHDLILTPADVIKQRQQLSAMKSRDIFKQIKQQEGWFSLIRSFKVTYIMNVPATSILMAVNESLKVWSFARNEHNFFSHFACAGIAGGVSALCTTPLDVVKTKLQTQKFELYSKGGFKNSSVNNTKKLNTQPQFGTSTSQTDFEQMKRAKQYIKYSNIKGTIQTILNEEGAKGFFRGAPTRIAMVAPSAAISWSCYEQMKKFLFKYHKQTQH